MLGLRAPPKAAGWQIFKRRWFFLAFFAKKNAKMTMALVKTPSRTTSKVLAFWEQDSEYSLRLKICKDTMFFFFRVLLFPKKEARTHDRTALPTRRKRKAPSRRRGSRRKRKTILSYSEMQRQKAEARQTTEHVPNNAGLLPCILKKAGFCFFRFFWNALLLHFGACSLNIKGYNNKFSCFRNFCEHFRFCFLKLWAKIFEMAFLSISKGNTEKTILLWLLDG